jgi:hypothetical protein
MGHMKTDGSLYLMALGSATLRKRFEGLGSQLRRTLVGLLALVALLSIPHLIWPKIDVTMLNTQVSRYDDRLTLVSYDLTNGSCLDLKEPMIACDTKPCQRRENVRSRISKWARYRIRWCFSLATSRARR